MSKAWSKISMTIHDFGLVEPVYSVREFSDLTGCSVQTLNRWHNNGVFVAKTHVMNNRKYKYYDDVMLADLYDSDVYQMLPQVRNKDLIGQRIGKLVIVDFSEQAKRKGYYASYFCHCDCGKDCVLARSELLSGKHLSCGCRYKDLSGLTFGEWYVDNFAGKYVSPSGDTCLQYNCTCSCGTKRTVLAQSLLSGRSYSCGCSRPDGSMSKAEACVVLYLERHGFVRNDTYFQYKTFSDLVGVGGGHLSYDFCIVYENNNILVECQGGQHFFPVDLWGGEDVFQRQLNHDEMKRQYALKHGFKLIEIPYTAFTYNQIELLLNDVFQW